MFNWRFAVVWRYCDVQRLVGRLSEPSANIDLGFDNILIIGHAAMPSRSREIVCCGYCDRSTSGGPWKGKQQHLKQHVGRKHPERLLEFGKKPLVHNPFWNKFLSTRAQNDLADEGKAVLCLGIYTRIYTYISVGVKRARWNRQGVVPMTVSTDLILIAGCVFLNAKEPIFP